jgi:hypothetical protein
MKIQRYRPTPDARMLADEAGSCVKFDDVSTAAAVLNAALSQPQGELREALEQVEGACLRIEMVSQAMRKGDPSSGLLNEAVDTIRAALAGRNTG